MAELGAPDISSARDSSESGPVGSRPVNADHARALRLEQTAALQIGQRSDGIAMRDRAGRKQQQMPDLGINCMTTPGLIGDDERIWRQRSQDVSAQRAWRELAQR